MIAPTVKKNPYIIGRPIYEQNLFFGRQRLFDFIIDNLSQGTKVILLHGQRRIGKSSVLRQIPQFVILEDFVFCSFDLQDQAKLPVGHVLYNLAQAIVEHFNLSQKKVLSSTKEQLINSPELFTDSFLPAVYQALDNKNLVLLLDEFDVLSEDTGEEAAKHFFPYLQSIINKQEKLSIIPVVGRWLDDVPTLLSLFHAAPVEEIGLLDKDSVTRLITQPAKGILEYEPEAIQKILDLCSGHPYLTQVICFTVFGYAREQEKWHITADDIENIADRAIETAEYGLAWLRDGLPIAERVMFSTLAAMQNRKDLDVSSRKEHPLNFLKNNGVVETELLRGSLGNLIKWGFVEETATLSYQVKIELVRRWLLKRYPFKEAIRDLEKLDAESTKPLYQTASEAWQKNQIQLAIYDYERVLEINPNHFNALFQLSEGYFQTDRFFKAVSLYERAYQYDSNRFQDEYYQSLVGYSKELLLRGQFELAVVQLKQAYLVDSKYVELSQLADELHKDNLVNLSFNSEARLYLEELLRKELNFLDEQIEIFRAYLKAWQRYQEKLEEYTQALLAETLREYPLKKTTRSNLFELQKRLGIKDEDAKTIGKRFTPELETKLEAAQDEYLTIVEQLMNEQGKISVVGYQILNTLREHLDILDDEARIIENQGIKKFDEHERAVEKFRGAVSSCLQSSCFDENNSFEVSKQMQEELFMLQSLIGLTNEEANEIVEKEAAKYPIFFNWKSQ